MREGQTTITHGYQVWVALPKENTSAEQMPISRTENECCITLTTGTRLLLFGGHVLPEERFLHWNFVSSSKERLVQTKGDWRNKRFPKIQGDDTYIHLP